MKSILEKYKCIYWDLGGQKLLRSIWPKYYLECHGIIFMVDGSNGERMEDVRECFSKGMNDY